MVTQNPGIQTPDLRWPPGLHLVDTAGWWVPTPLYQWQIDLLAAVCLPHSRVIDATPNESGKTSLLAKIFLLGSMVAWPGCYCYTTSGSENQVKEQLFINQLEPTVRNLKSEGWEISTASMTVTAPNGSRLIGYKCQDPGKVEGFHGYPDVDRFGRKYYRPCIYHIDESKTVSNDIHKAVRRIDPDFMMAQSTPGSRVGWFAGGINQDELDIIRKRDDQAA